MADSNYSRSKDVEARTAFRDLNSRSEALVAVPNPVTADFNLEDPRALINLVPPEMQQKILELTPEMLAYTEEELVKRAFVDEDPPSTFVKLRLSFWDAYDRAQRNEEEISTASLCRKVCPTQVFEKEILDRPLVLAWFLSPPADYMLALKEIHQLSLRSLRKAAALDPVGRDAKGNKSVNVKLIEAQNKIFQHVDMRLKGAIIQRIDQRNLNVNVDAPASPEVVDSANRVAQLSAAELEKKILEYQKKSLALSVPGAAVEVDLMKNTVPDTLRVDAEEETTGAETP